MKKFFLALLAGLVAQLFCGCDGDESYTINPDGSAKIEMTWRGSGLGVSNVANFSTGVEAWSDLKVEREDGEITAMTLTAYVPDITNCRINGSPGPRMQFRKAEDGGFIGGKPEGETQANEEVLPGDIDTAVEEIKKGLKLQSKMIGDRMGDGEAKLTIRVASKPKPSAHFKTLEDGALEMRMDFKKAKEVSEQLTSDDAKLRELARFGPRGFRQTLGEAVMLEMFGEANRPWIKIPAGGDPLFDYEAEAAAAKENERAMLLASGLYLTETPEEPENNPVLGIKNVRAGIEKSSRGAPKCAIRFAADLADNVVHVEGVRVVSAEDSDGTPCFPALAIDAQRKGGNFDTDSTDVSLLMYTVPPASGKFSKITCVALVGIGGKANVSVLGETDLK
ncbi:MAG: hypothetical protein AAF585_16540, partial [Verrucomicrobiota bacterium]